VCGLLTIIGDRFADSFDTALDSLTTRGPDERGHWHEDDIHLGHRRLSIIDLHAGQQPMLSADGRYAIAYNGEIYNFPDIRDELASLGQHMRTHCDTEVLLEGYAQWGQSILDRLDGMFAFVIWDRHEKTLFAARDRFGIKPLYYSVAGGFTAASTMESFFKLQGFPRRLDYHALREYLAVQSIPAPLTILRDVRSLPPASWLTWNPSTGQLDTARYWNIPHPTSSPMPFDDLVDATDAALATSVKRQLVADVPLGAFLSGGIDSSLMVHYMAEASSKPVKTFTVRFDSKNGYDESPYARIVAERYGCEHYKLNAHQITGDILAQSLSGLDQPLADPAYLPMRELCELTHKHVTVAITGDGGDELFGGYSRFLQGESSYCGSPAFILLHRLGMLPPSLRRRALSDTDALLWDRVKFGPFPGTRKDMSALLTPDAAHACAIDQTMQHWLDLAQRFGSPIETDQLMRADLWTYLSENCLVKSDRASMAHSLEARVPILGNPVVDLVLPQPASVKMQLGLKSVLVELSKRHLTPDVWDRPKHGFSVPLDTYFTGTWQQRCDDWVARCEELAPFLNAKSIRTRWSSCLNGRGDKRGMYTLIALLGWLDTHQVDA
jgi:asparagine synthase (glutamine-hydrolysing)